MCAQAPSYGQEVTGSGNQQFVQCCCCSKLCQCLAPALQQEVTQNGSWKNSRNSFSSSELEGTFERATKLVQQNHNFKMLLDFVYTRTKSAKMLIENSCFTPPEQNLRFGWKWHFPNACWSLRNNFQHSALTVHHCTTYLLICIEEA